MLPLGSVAWDGDVEQALPKAGPIRSGDVDWPFPTMSGGGFVRAVRFHALEEAQGSSTYPWALPAIAAVASRADGLALHPAVTY